MDLGIHAMGHHNLDKKNTVTPNILCTQVSSNMPVAGSIIEILQIATDYQRHGIWFIGSSNPQTIR